MIEFGQALVSMGLSKKLTFLFLFTWRYVSVMWEELSTILRAIKARAFEPKNNLHTYRTIGFVVAVLILRAYERSRRVQMAMDARGFQGRFYSLREFSWQWRDTLFMAITLLIIGALGVAQWPV
jgi:cobalt/nickel transport system permease protein